ncbi:hypothetical protein [Halopseudomonas salegens]|uniref:YokE-like PH domain-containing protein n=1 Tax=Halopseudomonas salegens TaxID=1434072 RepID=A0A1H2G372_9GAMM|nr:hypothetical protein [Halopseudomonas salegens]SDU14054.1 hypothetical protein SAMN05216210_2007 [Halopseudomonas salegens]
MSQSTTLDPSWAECLDVDFMFSNHKQIYKRRIEKRQRKLLSKIPDLSQFLRTDERVLLVATCCSPTSLLEQLTGGWIVFYINRALLVITDQRILHLPATPNFGYRDSIAQVEYADCEDIRVGSRHLKIRYRNGSKETFLFLRNERAKLKAHFKDFKSGSRRGPSSTLGGRVHLCPRCTAPLQPDHYQCDKCRLTFKDMGTATRLSLLLPGGGYFYTGHWFLGIGDLMVEAGLLLLVADAMSGGLAGQEGSWEAATFFGGLLAIEKLITVYHARRYIREYLPNDRPVTPRG